MEINGTIPAGLDMGAVSGPLLMGYLLQWGLFGTLSVQLFLYYMAFPKDRLLLKTIVYFVYALETAQTILMTKDAFISYGSGFGDFSALRHMGSNWFAIPVMSGIVSFIGQLFFAYRIWILSRSRPVPILILVMALASTVASFVDGYFLKKAGTIDNISDTLLLITATIWCGGSALCDVFIAASMTFYLSRSKNSSYFPKTKLLISRLILITIETGTLTATVAALVLALYIAFPNKTYYITAALIVPKTYANTILVILNSRFRIVGGRDSDDYASSVSNSTVPEFTTFPDLSTRGSTWAQQSDIHPPPLSHSRSLPTPTASGPEAVTDMLKTQNGVLSDKNKHSFGLV